MLRRKFSAIVVLALLASPALADIQIDASVDGVTVRGDGISATAQRVHYDSATETIICDGTKDSPAKFEATALDGKKVKTEALRITYDFKKKRMTLMNLNPASQASKDKKSTDK